MISFTIGIDRDCLQSNKAAPGTTFFGLRRSGLSPRLASAANTFSSVMNLRHIYLLVIPPLLAGCYTPTQYVMPSGSGPAALLEVQPIFATGYDHAHVDILNYQCDGTGKPYGHRSENLAIFKTPKDPPVQVRVPARELHLYLSYFVGSSACNLGVVTTLEADKTYRLNAQLDGAGFFKAGVCNITIVDEQAAVPAKFEITREKGNDLLGGEVCRRRLKAKAS